MQGKVLNVRGRYDYRSRVRCRYGLRRRVPVRGGRILLPGHSSVSVSYTPARFFVSALLIF